MEIVWIHLARPDTTTAAAQTAAQEKKEPAIPATASREGKILMERKTVTERRKAVMEVAVPRTLLGNSSPNSMKGTGPRPQAYPKVMRTQEMTGTMLRMASQWPGGGSGTGSSTVTSRSASTTNSSTVIKFYQGQSTYGRGV